MQGSNGKTLIEKLVTLFTCPQYCNPAYFKSASANFFVQLLYQILEVLGRVCRLDSKTEEFWIKLLSCKLVHIMSIWCSS
jgi:hypothetical protein